MGRGRLIPMHRGVYAVAHRSLPPLARYLAAVLAVGDNAFLSHHAASGAWGLSPQPDGDVDVTVVGRDAGRRRAGIHVHRHAESLDSRDVTRRHNIPIVVPALALLDTAPELSSRDLERTFDGALKARIVTRAAVAATIARHRRHPGAARLAALTQAELRTSTVPKSMAEERFLELARAGGLPIPEVNVQVGRYKVDALWRDVGLIVEIDGYEFHSTRRSFDEDHERDQYFADHNLAVTRFTRDQVVTAPAVVLVRLTQRLTSLLNAQSPRSSRIVS